MLRAVQELLLRELPRQYRAAAQQMFGAHLQVRLARDCYRVFRLRGAGQAVGLLFSGCVERGGMVLMLC